MKGLEVHTKNFEINSKRDRQPVRGSYNMEDMIMLWLKLKRKLRVRKGA